MNLMQGQAQGQKKHIFNETANVELHAGLQAAAGPEDQHKGLIAVPGGSQAFCWCKP